ncbi:MULTISPECIES: SDR family oxidoreductase [unclassified Pseudoalteromonas]|uniref:SDR family oxidoreductase n=1 Tax=unclassified Pseudoalteromonas TaxID=194690 RepID=UPI0025B46240|nr:MULTISPECIES: SDR family oxidoreductase [unclassified Pseudoalteromonas]MDN3376846.1 SDR family oxidoreductase [Pseudoalteromonas sp. APC 3893]MDN3387444.1 SDR family oxidoreductase [Pseudoalteromonas sp. APC 4017]
MSKTLIIGASGQIGKMTTKLLLSQQQQVVALVRDKSKLSDLSGSFLTIVEQDLEGDFSQAFEDCDQVIFAAGSGGNTGADKTILIDLWAATKAVNYAKGHDIKHFIMVSSIGADDPDAIESELKPYLVAKHMADEHLKLSDLNYTIVRPGALTDESASMKISSERPSDRSDAKISRENVANTLVHIATKTFSDNKVFELFDGDKSISVL